MEVILEGNAWERMARPLRDLRPNIPFLAKKSLPKRTMQCASSGIGIATIDEFEVAWCHSCGKLAAGAIEEVTSSTPFQARSVSKPLSLLQKPPAGRLLTAETRVTLRRPLQILSTEASEFLAGERS